MAWWTQILPLFWIKWFARRRIQRITVGGTEYVWAYPDVLIREKPAVMTRDDKVQTLQVLGLVIAVAITFLVLWLAYRGLRHTF